METLFDLHTHALASSHAFSTLRGNIEGTGRKGLWVVNTSDHAEKMPEANPNVFISYKAVQKPVGGVRVFCGIKVNICDFDRTIDVGESLPRKMDYVMASLHIPCTQSRTAERNAAALIGAMKNTYMETIIHPDGSRYPLDYKVLIQAAKELGATLELNSSSLIPNSAWLDGRENARILLNICKRFGAPVILGSGAHIWCDVDRSEEAYALLEEVSSPQGLILSLNPDGIRAVLSESCTRI